MNVLLIRLCGPMQSWGTQSRFSVRDTGLEPSKSGVVGLLCAALGRSRSTPVDDLTALRMGVRVDQEGSLSYDFQTAQNVLKASGGIKDTELSNRYYLADARFLVGLEGRDLALLGQLHAALQNPVWALYLGRKAFVPSETVWLPATLPGQIDGLRSGEKLEETLQTYPWLGRTKGSLPERLRLVIEDPSGSEVRLDQPISFAERRFALRRVRTVFIPLPPISKELSCIFPA